MPRRSLLTARLLRPVLVALLAASAALAASLASVVPADAAPVSRVPGTAIEIYSPYQGQTTCNPAPKPGTLALSTLVLAAYPGTSSSGIARDCSIGGRSEHKEGRAWDWHVSYASPTQRAQAADFVHWLFATDVYGNRFSQARRLGVMYVIWNSKIWSAAQAGSGWRPYTGADPHTGHMHISLSWAGAQKKTSYWTGVVSPILKAPTPVKAPVPLTPAEVPATANQPVPTATEDDPHGLPVFTDGERVLDVLATTSGATTPWAVRAGRHYLVTAVGMYAYGDGVESADAECSRWPSDTYWHRTAPDEGRRSTGALDLTINGRSTSWTPLVDDGNDCDTTTHTYTLVLQARKTGALRLAIADSRRGDDGGGLHVVVRALDTVSPTD
ncbi:MAG: hypothetical protein LC789_16025 [Actinobacteria bacterium]|nr:hypothetical protein [Actinomycetota bacterium]